MLRCVMGQQDRYLDGQPGTPVRIEKTSTEMTWYIHLDQLALVMVIHGKPDYLGCSVKRAAEVTSTKS